jgi:hypothetical protein
MRTSETSARPMSKSAPGICKLNFGMTMNTIWWDQTHLHVGNVGRLILMLLKAAHSAVITGSALQPAKLLVCSGESHIECALWKD